MSEKRICKFCSLEKDVEAFRRAYERNGKVFYRYTCKDCFNLEERGGKPSNGDGRFKKGNIAKHPFPKGHIPWSKLNKGKYNLPRRSNERGSARYKDWIRAIKERDGNICRECGSGKNIEAHHIYDFDDFPDKRFDIDNGVALCKSCHVKITRMQEQLKSCKILWLKD